MSATRPDGPLPVLRRFPTDTSEAQGVARALRRAHGPGRAWANMAVLARTNAQLVILDEHLRRAGVPCRLSGNSALVHQPEVKAALEQLRRAPPGMPFLSRLADLESLYAEDGEGSEERRLNLHALVQLGRDYAALDPGASVDGFRGWLSAGGRDDQPEGRPDAVELTTFHRAKGLEWPVVVVTGLEAGLVPIGHAATPAAQEEERRLLYVALTRALDELHCTWAERRSFGTRSLSRQPSPYLKAMESTVAAMARGGTPEDWRARIQTERDKLRRASSAGNGGARAGRDVQREGGSGQADPAVLAELRAWRSSTARASGVPAYVIFHDATLSALAAARPTTRSELLELPGLGPVKAERYGDTLLALLARSAS